MDKKKKILIIAGSACGAVLIALIAVIIVLANRPNVLLARSISNTVNDAKKIEAYKIANDVANGGSISLDANLDDFIDDIKVQTKCYTNAKASRGALDLTLTEDDETVLRSQIRIDSKSVTANAPELFDGTYGINISKLSKNLPGSIFDPEEDSDYALDDDQYEYLMNLWNATKDSKKLSKEGSEIARKYEKLFMKGVQKYGELSRSKDTIDAGDEDLRCDVITITLDEESLSLILQDILDYARDDKELEDYMLKVMSVVSYDDDPEDLVDDFFDEFDYFEDDLEDLESEDINLNVSFYITSGRRVAQIDANIEEDGDPYEISLVLGKNVAKSKEIGFYVEEGSTKVSAVYTVKENSKKAFEAEFKIKESGGYGEHDSRIKLEWDKKDGDIVIKLEDGSDEYVIKGNLTQKADKLTFLLTGITENGESTDWAKSMELTIVLDRHDPTPKVSSRFTEITKLGERDFKHFAEDVKDGIDDIIGGYLW